MSLDTARAEAVARLKTAGIENPVREAELLFGAAFPRKYIDYETIFTEAFATRYAELVTRRVAREPMSHITGRRAFWNAVFEVSSAVLDPRPDTETLVEAALQLDWSRLLDLGTGSGCILLSLLAERGEATGLGVDISAEALSIAKRNRAALELDTRAELAESDWFAAVEGKFDLIVSNPPYITADAYEKLQPEVRLYEPKIALTPGGDGLAAYRIIAAQSAAYLTPQGRVMVEIGHDQGGAVQTLFARAGFTDVSLMHDINGKDRVVLASLR